MRGIFNEVLHDMKISTRDIEKNTNMSDLQKGWRGESRQLPPILYIANVVQIIFDTSVQHQAWQETATGLGRISSLLSNFRSSSDVQVAGAEMPGVKCQNVGRDGWLGEGIRHDTAQSVVEGPCKTRNRDAIRQLLEEAICRTASHGLDRQRVICSRYRGGRSKETQWAPYCWTRCFKRLWWREKKHGHPSCYYSPHRCGAEDTPGQTNILSERVCEVSRTHNNVREARHNRNKEPNQSSLGVIYQVQTRVDIEIVAPTSQTPLIQYGHYPYADVRLRNMDTLTKHEKLIRST